MTSAFRRAHKMCQESTNVIPMGAVIVKKGKIISASCNQELKTHPYIKEYGHHNYIKSIHAELSAILKVKNRDQLRGATIVIYRERKDKSFGVARPCAMCYEIIKRFGIKKMQYTTENGIQEEFII